MAVSQQAAVHKRPRLNEHDGGLGNRQVHLLLLGICPRVQNGPPLPHPFAKAGFKLPRQRRSRTRRDEQPLYAKLTAADCVGNKRVRLAPIADDLVADEHNAICFVLPWLPLGFPLHVSQLTLRGGFFWSPFSFPFFKGEEAHTLKKGEFSPLPLAT